MAALTSYFGGESFHFGWTPTNARLGKIQKRIEDFCGSATLGWKARNPVAVSPNSNEVGIDVLVWKQPKDLRSNALVFVAQCATGHNWRAKLETSSLRLLEDCLETTRDGPWVSCFCTPFHIPDSLWRDSARRHDGMLFDRIRLVLARRSGSTPRTAQEVLSETAQWTNRVVKKLVKQMRTKTKKRRLLLKRS